MVVSDIIDALKKKRKRIIFNNVGLNDNDMIIIKSYIEENEKLGYIDFGNNKIGSKGASVLMYAIRGTKVKHLDLSNNLIGNSGLAAIARIVETSNIEVLNLSDNRFTNDGMKRFGTMLSRVESLKKLDISNNKLTSIGLELLIDGLRENKSLREINMSGIKVPIKIFDEFYEALEEGNVRKLNFKFDVKQKKKIEELGIMVG